MDIGAAEPRVDRGPAEAALIDAQHPVTAREMRHPLAPGFRAFGEPVNEQDRLGLIPRIGVIVDHVMQLAVGQFEIWHTDTCEEVKE